MLRKFKISAPQKYGFAPSVVRCKGRKFELYLVSQGHIVGVFDDRLETQASVSGYPDNSFRTYHSMVECIEAWQALCRWGIHPHKVDPEYATGADAVLSPSPEESTTALVSPRKSGMIDLKHFCPPPPSRTSKSSPQNGAMPQKTVSPQAATSSQRADHHLNFVIRGGGIVSSSARRTEEQYWELQSQGEEPDHLLTRSLEAASFFALDDREV
ncbi:hypothetical protein K438DRAFT_1994414 [Mycena galopus ATCC 62051]|nr:hypothetical protein K438DRAFT_1994414 [Mycena galopus ATCC 62051]